MRNKNYDDDDDDEGLGGTGMGGCNIAIEKEGNKYEKKIYFFCYLLEFCCNFFPLSSF